MPAKMSMETPLPRPYSEISSPIHIRSIEPATTVMRLTVNGKSPSEGKTPERSRMIRKEMPCTAAMGSVSQRLYMLNLARPASPSSWYICLSAGIMSVSSCMTMLAVI